MMTCTQLPVSWKTFFFFFIDILIGHIYIHHIRADTYNQLREPTKTTYDYIIIGGGSAGCVLAARLSEDPNVTVLLLEAGEAPSLLTRLAVRVPIAAPSLLGSHIDWGYKTQPQKHAAGGMEGRSINLPAGKTLGGTSVLNMMINTPGPDTDYTAWQTMGAAGWEDMKEYVKKVEKTYKASRREPTRLSKAFIQAAGHLGIPEGDEDRAGVGPGFIQHKVHTENGERFTAFDMYLRPVMNRRNLDVVVGAHVNKILLNGVTTSGVEYLTDNLTTVRNVSCVLEVVLCAGAVSSPAILMRSGIGPKEQLEEHGILTISDRKVGENLMDHPMIGLFGHLSEDVSLNENKIKSFSSLYNYVRHRKGPLSTPGGITAIGFTSSSIYKNSGLADLEFYLMEMGSIRNEMMREMGNIKEDLWNGGYLPHDNGPASKGFFIAVVLTRPYSRGRVTLKSPSPSDYPYVDPMYLHKPEDVTRLVEGVKAMHQLINTTVFKDSLGAKLHTPNISMCQQHIEHTDKHYACMARNIAASSWHPVGTCRMGAAQDKTAVTDPKLKVIGVEGLRVADASVMPTISSCNPLVQVLVIAERASDLIKQDHNRKHLEH